MRYDNIILRVLAEAGEHGLCIKKISRHVYNESNTFFNRVNFDDVHHDVQRFLMRHSRQPQPLVEHMETRGMYRLNPHSPESRQLMLQFFEEDPEPLTKPMEDQSLWLF